MGYKALCHGPSVCCQGKPAYRACRAASRRLNPAAFASAIRVPLRFLQGRARLVRSRQELVRRNGVLVNGEPKLVNGKQNSKRRTRFSKRKQGRLVRYIAQLPRQNEFTKPHRKFTNSKIGFQGHSVDKPGRRIVQTIGWVQAPRRPAPRH